MIPIVAPATEDCATPVYFSEIYVRADSCFYDIAQLQDSIFAYNDESSLSGYHCMKFFLKGLKESQICSIRLPFFRGVLRTGAHVASLRALVNHKADAAVVDCKVVADLMETVSGRELLKSCRSIYIPSCSLTVQNGSSVESIMYNVSMDGKLGPNPAQPIVTSRRLSARQIELIKTALLSCSEDSLAPLRCTRFVEVDDTFYNNITMMMEACIGVDIIFGTEANSLSHDCTMNSNLL